MLIYRSLRQVKQSVLAKGYKFFDKSVNLIGERTNDTFTNTFSDMLHCCYFDYSDNTQKIVTIPWTTKAGIYGKGSTSDPITASGFNIATNKWETVTGTGVIVEGQYDKVWQFVDSYIGWLRYPYFQEVGPFLIYRDGNKDLNIDRDMPIHKGVFGINGHRMSGVGQSTGLLSYINSNPWSIACQGAPEQEFKKLLPIIRADVTKFGSLFSYTLLNSKDIQSI